LQINQSPSQRNRAPGKTDHLVFGGCRAEAGRVDSRAGDNVMKRLRLDRKPHVHELQSGLRLWREDQERAAGLATEGPPRISCRRIRKPKAARYDSACERESEKVDDLRFVARRLGQPRRCEERRESHRSAPGRHVGAEADGAVCGRIKRNFDSMLTERNNTSCALNATFNSPMACHPRRIPR